MALNKYTVTPLLFFGMLFISCQHKETEIPDESYVAFSLREAQQLIKRNSAVNDSAVYNLGGITRLVGMVIDRKNNDIVFVGKKINKLPTARFDDLVTALRARFVYNELPLVSIDPTTNSLTTGKQEVRFGGHIEGTSFGQDFLQSDILLKMYSLELSQQVKNVTSYKKLFADDELDKLKQLGINVKSLNWITADSINKIKVIISKSEKCTQSRFWYNYNHESSVRIRGNVFCIMALDVVIEDEVHVTLNGASQKNDSSNSKTLSPGQRFSNLFTENFYKISDTYPIIKRLKLLFDMTALAEGLKNTKDIPDIGFLLNSYPVKKINTIKEFGLTKMYASIVQADGKTNITQLSGGVEPSIDLQWLNEGDVSVLEKFVLKSRPDQHSLFWRIPIDSWDMPNSRGLIIKEHIENANDNSGFSLNTINVIAVAKTIDNMASSKNLKDIISNIKQSSLPAIQTGGVDMKMKIDTSSFQHDNSLNGDFFKHPK